MEGGAFAYSHLLGKTVWGHQAMAALISDGETALCYKLERCGKNDAGKIEQAAEIASSLPMAERLSYALMDSWYTCPKVTIQSALSKPTGSSMISYPEKAFGKPGALRAFLCTTGYL